MEKNQFNELEYYKHFIHSINRTIDWDLNPGEITIDKSACYISDQTENDLIELYNKHMVNLPEDRRECCLSVSYYLSEFVSEYFSTDAYLTIGNVHDFEFLYFECSEEYLYNLLNEKNIDRSKLKIHVWLTLSSGEIVDFTLFKGLAKRFEKWKIFENKIVLGLPNRSEIKLNYLPFVVGENFLERSGVIVK